MCKVTANCLQVNESNKQLVSPRSALIKTYSETGNLRMSIRLYEQHMHYCTTMRMSRNCHTITDTQLMKWQ